MRRLLPLSAPRSRSRSCCRPCRPLARPRPPPPLVQAAPVKASPEWTTTTTSATPKAAAGKRRFTEFGLAGGGYGTRIEGGSLPASLGTYGAQGHRLHQRGRPPAPEQPGRREHPGPRRGRRDHDHQPHPSLQVGPRRVDHHAEDRLASRWPTTPSASSSSAPSAPAPRPTTTRSPGSAPTCRPTCSACGSPRRAASGPGSTSRCRAGRSTSPASVACRWATRRASSTSRGRSPAPMPSRSTSPPPRPGSGSRTAPPRSSATSAPACSAAAPATLEAKALGGLINVGRTQNIVMPCSGTGGQVKQDSVLDVDLPGVLEVSVGGSRQMGKQNARRCAGPLRGVQPGPRRPRRRPAGHRRHQGLGQGQPPPLAEVEQPHHRRQPPGTTVGSITLNGQKLSLPQDIPSIEIPGLPLLSVKFNVVERGKWGAKAIAVQLSVLDVNSRSTAPRSTSAPRC